VILADTSAWVEYDRATGTAVDVRMTELIERGGALAVTDPVLMEVLGGAQDPLRRDDLGRLLHRFDWLPCQPEVDFPAAADIYRACRSVGVTPRGYLDCMIAQIALRTGATLLQRDVDLQRVAEVIGVRLDQP
jgi:predicted nucleic acid-binding protein